MHRKDFGFTLIELMVVVAIAAIILTIGVPGFQTVTQRVRVDSALNLVGTDLAMARASAVMRRSPVVVCPRDGQDRCRNDQDWSAGWMIFEDTDGNRQPDDPAQVLRVTDLPSGDSAVLYLPSTRPYVRYQPDGRSANTNLTIHLCARGRLAGQAIVNNVGRVRTLRAFGDEPCPRS